MRKVLMIAVLLTMMTGLAWAAKPFFVFEPGGGPGRVPDDFKVWHPHEDVEDYGESWFFQAKPSDKAMLFAMVSITNIGPGTYNGSIDIQYYGEDGNARRFHKDVKRENVNASTDKLDVKVGNTHVWADKSGYRFTVDYPEVGMDLTITNGLPSLMFGDGAVKFNEDKSGEWTTGINVPMGVTKGTIAFGQKTFDLGGKGYHDHGWSTMKMPDIFRQWDSLRIYGEKYTIVLHQQSMTKTWGGAINRYGVLGVDNKIVAPLRNFTFKPQDRRKTEKGKYDVPRAFAVDFTAKGYTVKGTVTYATHFDEIDVLGQVNAFLRAFIKAFYSKPFMHRYLADYDLTVTTSEGATEVIKGRGVVESNNF